MGVPRITKAANTQVKEFALSSARSSTVRKKDMPEELKPLYSSFGSNSARGTFARPSVVSKPPAARKAPAPAPIIPKKAPEVAAAPVAEVAAPVTSEAAPAVEVAAPVAAETTKAAPVDISDALNESPAADAPAPQEDTPQEAAPTEAAPAASIARPIAPETLAAEVAYIEALEEWKSLVDEKQQPSGARRVWAKDALPAYMQAGEEEGAEEEDEEKDADYAPQAPTTDDVVEAVETHSSVTTAACSKARVWATDALPAYMAREDAAEEEADDDDDYVPTPKGIKKKLAKISPAQEVLLADNGAKELSVYNEPASPAEVGKIFARLDLRSSAMFDETTTAMFESLDDDDAAEADEAPAAGPAAGPTGTPPTIAHASMSDYTHKTRLSMSKV